MNTVSLNGPAQRFLAAVQGVRASHVATALASLCLCQLPRRSRTHWSGCSKGTMAREYGAAMGPQWRNPDPVRVADLRRPDVATLERRARACAEGRAGWACIGAQGGRAATTPAPRMVEIALEVFKASVLVAQRQEVHDESHSLWRTEDPLRAAEQRLKAVPEHKATLPALVSQAAMPGGVSRHELTRPGSRLERAQQVLTVQLGASSGQRMRA